MANLALSTLTAGLVTAHCVPAWLHCPPRFTPGGCTSIFPIHSKGKIAQDLSCAILIQEAGVPGRSADAAIVGRTPLTVPATFTVVETAQGRIYADRHVVTA